MLKNKGVLKIILIVLGLFGLLYLNLSPNLQNFRDSWAFGTLFTIIISGIILYFAFKYNEGNTIVSLTLLIILVFLVWLMRLVFSYRTNLLILFVYSLTSLLIYFVLYLKTKKSSKSAIAISFITYLVSVLPVLEVTTLDGKTSHFWQLSLIISIVISLIPLYFSIFKDNIYDDSQNRIFVPLLCLMGVFGFVFLSANSLNFILDRSEPTYVEAEVVEMDIQTGYRTTTKYELVIKIEGEEFYLDVSQSEYYRITEGDIINISIYDGFFNIPYYTYED